MSDVFNEVNEELRQEKLQALWNDNKYFIIGSIILAVVFTALFGFWKDWKQNTYTAETTAFYTALNTTEIENLVDYTKIAKGDHVALSKLSASSLYLNKNETSKALDMVKSIQNDRGVSKIYRDFAILLESQYVLNDGDNKSLSELEAKLIPLTNARNAWRLSAQESLALIAGKQGDFTKAISIIDRLLSTPALPAKMNERVKQLKALYVVQQKSSSDNNKEK